MEYNLSYVLTDIFDIVRNWQECTQTGTTVKAPESAAPFRANRTLKLIFNAFYHVLQTKFDHQIVMTTTER